MLPKQRDAHLHEPARVDHCGLSDLHAAANAEDAEGLALAERVRVRVDVRDVL